MQYNIGADFCLEDPTMKFHLLITCLFVQDPLPVPTPEFQWTLVLNNTDLSSEDMYHYGLSVYQDGNNLTLNGTLVVGLSDNLTLDVICFINNTYGNDTESTSISLCGKYITMP